MYKIHKFLIIKCEKMRNLVYQLTNSPKFKNKQKILLSISSTVKLVLKYFCVNSKNVYTVLAHRPKNSNSHRSILHQLSDQNISKKHFIVKLKILKITKILKQCTVFVISQHFRLHIIKYIYSNNTELVANLSFH